LLTRKSQSVTQVSTHDAADSVRSVIGQVRNTASLNLVVVIIALGNCKSTICRLGSLVGNDGRDCSAEILGNHPHAPRYAWALYFGVTQLIIRRRPYEPLATHPQDAERMEACARVSGKTGRCFANVSRPKRQSLRDFKHRFAC
jgi:hypothetical protein